MLLPLSNRRTCLSATLPLRLLGSHARKCGTESRPSSNITSRTSTPSGEAFTARVSIRSSCNLRFALGHQCASATSLNQETPICGKRRKKVRCRGRQVGCKPRVGASWGGAARRVSFRENQAIRDVPRPRVAYLASKGGRSPRQMTSIAVGVSRSMI